MKTPDFVYVYGEKQYYVFLSKNFQRNIYFRFKEDGFHISAPLFVSKKKIIEGLNKFAPKLIERFVPSNKHFNFKENYFYFLGEKLNLSDFNISNVIELEKYLKKEAKKVFENLVRQYEQIMKITNPYKISIRKTTSRYGSNSSMTHRLSFQLDLIHYSIDIISTVVVHELAHEFHRNHQKEFYDCVYLYCPNYKELQNKLRRGIHS